MRYAVIVLLVLLALFVSVALVGGILPEQHVIARSAHYQQPPEKVWQTISDFGGQASWRPDVDRSERLPDRDGHQVWKEVDRRGHGLPLETVVANPPKLLVRRIADPKLPFGGEWIYQIAPDSSGGSILTITERGEVHNPIFRLVSRYWIGHNSTADRYLEALGGKFGESVQPVQAAPANL